MVSLVVPNRPMEHVQQQANGLNFPRDPLLFLSPWFEATHKFETVILYAFPCPCMVLYTKSRQSLLISTILRFKLTYMGYINCLYHCNSSCVWYLMKSFAFMKEENSMIYINLMEMEYMGQGLGPKQYNVYKFKGWNTWISHIAPHILYHSPPPLLLSMLYACMRVDLTCVWDNR